MNEQLSFDARISESAAQDTIDTITGKADEFTTDDNFSYAGYQITREEFFAHAREPSLTICGNRLYTNKVCLRKAPDTERVLIMINSTEKKIVLKPCLEDIKDSIPWVTSKGNMRHILCKPAFCSLISELTGWNLDNRYKMIGKLIRNQGERIIIFDLNAALAYPCITMKDDCENITKRSMSREPVYMESWKHQFGMLVEEHERAYAINRFDDYVVISVQKKIPRVQMRPQLDREENK